MPFEPGRSGNPQGRRRGSRNRATVLRERLASDAEGILDGMIMQAKAGDIGAARFLLGLIIPKATELPVRIRATGTLAQKGEAIMAAALAGRITPSEAASLLAGLASQVRIVEATEIETRLQKVEKKLNHEHD